MVSKSVSIVSILKIVGDGVNKNGVEFYVSLFIVYFLISVMSV